MAWVFSSLLGALYAVLPERLGLMRFPEPMECFRRFVAVTAGVWQLSIATVTGLWCWRRAPGRAWRAVARLAGAGGGIAFALRHSQPLWTPDGYIFPVWLPRSGATGVFVGSNGLGFETVRQPLTAVNAMAVLDVELELPGLLALHTMFAASSIGGLLLVVWIQRWLDRRHAPVHRQA